MAWSLQDERSLVRLAKEGRFFYTEIATKLGKTPQSVRWKAKQLDLPSTQRFLKDRFGKWNSKHNHLREPVMRYFMTHTWDETLGKFKLTQSELKSLFTVGYRLPQLKHLRKETRRHDSWSTKELKFLITHAGIMPRDWIGKTLKRGTPVCVKERMQKLGISSRTINGITLSQFRSAFGKEPDFYIQTKAGPGRNGTPTCFKIIPWVYLDQEIRTKKLKAPKVFRQLASTMALFQDWIFEGNVVSKLQRIARKA